MANLKIIFLITALLACGITTDAQTKKKKPVQKAQPVKDEPSPADILFDDMLGSTAKVMFIDSVVADKKSFIKAIPLNRESGSLNTYDDFWETTGQTSSYAYMNEFGNKVLFSKAGDDGHSRLYTADRLNGQWSAPKPINDFDNEFEDINCPYMLSDGITLYFAAKGKNSVGGYDIFVTMYDNDSARFYKPENVGLPYNSKANDYYCVIDEFNHLGWLVTDRNQPEGKVCVYTFIHSDSRQTYNENEIDEAKLRNIAAISSIKDSWTDKTKLQDAQKRLTSLKQSGSDENKSAMSFFINDNTVYGQMSDFKVAANRQRYARLTAMEADKADIDSHIDALRRQYGSSAKAAKRSLAPKILKAEQQSEQLDIKIKTLAKDIRNTENKAIKQ